MEQKRPLDQHGFEGYGKICVAYSSQFQDLQLFAELARLGREYCADALQHTLAHKEASESQRGLADAVAGYATRQRSHFYDLTAILLIRLSGLLEAFVSDSIQFAIEHHRCALKSERLQKIKGEIVPFMFMSDSERAEYLLQRLSGEFAGGNLSGIDKYQAVLKEIGLGGDIPAVVRQILYKSARIRNCVVHRNGIVDRRLRKEVRDVDTAVGNRISLSGAACRALLFATLWYFLDIQHRILDGDGRDLSVLIDERDEYYKMLDSERYNTMASPFAE